MKDSLNLDLHEDAQVSITNGIVPLAQITFPEVHDDANTAVAANAKGADHFAEGTVKEVELDHGVFDIELSNGKHVKYGK